VLTGKQNMDEFACGGSTEHSVTGDEKPLGFVQGCRRVQRRFGGRGCGRHEFLFPWNRYRRVHPPASFAVRSRWFEGYLWPRFPQRSNTMASSWDTIGPLGKTVQDVATVLQVILAKIRDLRLHLLRFPIIQNCFGQSVKGLKIVFQRNILVKASIRRWKNYPGGFERI